MGTSPSHNMLIYQLLARWMGWTRLAATFENYQRRQVSGRGLARSVSAWERGLRGDSRGPLLRSEKPGWKPKLECAYHSCLVQALCDSDLGLTEDVHDLSIPEARCVVLKRQFGSGIVEAEFAQAVGVGELAEALQLVIGQG